MHSFPINPWMILPFVVLLGAIAFIPLLSRKWWEHHYAKVAIGLGAITLGYYLGFLKEFQRPLSIAHEYFSFICLIGSLFVVSAGIHIRVHHESKPWVNTLMLALGGILANVIGTTGASMLMIRPFLRANKYRVTSHHVIFFIFIVGNIGGSLTPIGDPPLYLGYLKGIPFLWPMHTLYTKWMIGMAWLLAIFYIIDTLNYQRAPPEIREKETAHETWRVDGLFNLIWLALILRASFISSPLFVREGLMILAAFMSWLLTRPHVHESNQFSWMPLREVVILFAGIFATMMPALDWLEGNAKNFGAISPGCFYWCSGILSSILDNAPTYFSFLSGAIGLFINQTVVEQVHQLMIGGTDLIGLQYNGPHALEVMNTIRVLNFYDPSKLAAKNVSVHDIEIGYLLGNHLRHIAAISIGSVFFGACTYIGNGPNLMVKSIAEHWGVKMPGFLGYIFKFTLPFLFPMLIAVWWIFFS